MPKTKILAFMDYYLPGNKAGGPIRTVANIVDHLSNDIEFNIVTRDHDLVPASSYENIKHETWNSVGKANVYYLSKKERTFSNIRNICNNTDYDILYLNSFFSYPFTIKLLLLRKLNLIHKTPIILAPRGEFSKGSLSLKRFKKIIYITVAKFSGLYHDVIWQASSEYEEEDIKKNMGENIITHIAPDLPPVIDGTEFTHPVKVPGKLRIISVSRISSMKNITAAIETLKNAKGAIEFNIYGPMENKEYWKRCENIISQLPPEIDVKYCGSLGHDEVIPTMAEHHIFLLTTLGENFGHVILEALLAGCPVLISDRTPWRDLEKSGIGWDVPLERPELFEQIIQKCIDMDNIEYNIISKQAMQYAINYSNNNDVIDKTRVLFTQSLKIQHSNNG